nr:phosphoglycerate kinase [Mycoplasmopsis bovis]
MKKSIDDVKFMGKKVLMRADFNVPIKNGVITSNKRIVAAIPTIKKIINEGGKLILMSHLGRIKSADDMAKNDLFPVSVELSNLLNKPVLFVDSDKRHWIRKRYWQYA